MSKFIKTLFDRIERLNLKGYGKTFSPEEVVEEVHTESLNIWKKYIKEFEKTQEISVYMEPLRGKETVTLTSGAGTMTTAKGQYKTAIMIPNTDVEIDLIDVGHWSNAVNDVVRVPSAEYPICRVDFGSIIVRPTSLPSVDVHFIKQPTKPVYAYAVVDDEYVYDDSTSVDFEWPPPIHDEIANRVLGNLGYAQREGEAVQYSNMEMTKEGR
jgi:hypothetical protein